jgi:hypothetical protein
LKCNGSGHHTDKHNNECGALNLHFTIQSLKGMQEKKEYDALKAQGNNSTIHLQTAGKFPGDLCDIN